MDGWVEVDSAPMMAGRRLSVWVGMKIHRYFLFSLSSPLFPIQRHPEHRLGNMQKTCSQIGKRKEKSERRRTESFISVETFVFCGRRRKRKPVRFPLAPSSSYAKQRAEDKKDISTLLVKRTQDEAQESNNFSPSTFHTGPVLSNSTHWQIDSKTI
jgi:hypothetical protein